MYKRLRNDNAYKEHNSLLHLEILEFCQEQEIHISTWGASIVSVDPHDF